MTTLPGFTGHLVTSSYLERCAKLTAADPSLNTRWKAAIDAHAAARRVVGPASSVRSIFETVLVPLAAALGFEPAAEATVVDESLTTTIRALGQPVAVIVLPWGERCDPYWRQAVVEARRRSATWCLIVNGTGLRIVDATRLYARRFVHSDLALTLDRADTFAALVRLAGAEALGSSPAAAGSLHELIANSDREAAGVCRSLRDGVLAASTEVLRALVARDRSRACVDDAFEQSLTIVYRVLFLLFAEARALVPVWHPVYRDSYSVDALRDAAERPAARGFWDALRAMARLAHAGCRAGDLRVAPFNGRLFAPARAPLAERRDLDDEAARRAVLSLATRAAADRAGRERIVYRDLGVEQLGAVYETLLDYRPRVERSPLVVRLEAGSGIRKTTGTFYTPQPLADYLVRRALGPLIRGASADAILKLRVVDPAMGSGAFLVAACRFLAAAYEQALIDEGSCHATDVAESDRAAMRRLVAERCLYGVDLNPMAVQLARLSLWLATLAADRPLSFLDHRLMPGDSLLGAWVRQLARAPARSRTSRQTLPLFPDAAADAALTAAVPIRFSLESTPNDTVEQVRAKERALNQLSDSRSPLARWRRIANLWCARWFAGGPDELPAEAYGALVDHILSGTGALPSRSAATYQERAETIAATRRFFHWELEFPEVFFGENGARLANPGFDAVIGNPPWDMLRADTGDAAARARDRSDVSAAVRFTRDAGVYSAQSVGHANRYQLFVERAIALTRANGRIGLVLPSGLAVDHGSAALRRHLLRLCDVDAVVGIDNHRGIFPIHRSVRFLLLTASAGRSTERIRSRFGVSSLAELEAVSDADSESEAFPTAFTPAVLERLSGASLAIPYVRSAIDLRILEKAAALWPALGDPPGWAARFGRELNASDDRDAFRATGAGWPVVDGKHLEPFSVSIAETTRSIAANDARRLLGADRVERPRLAYRDVASATNRLTLIAALLPPRVASTHTVFCLRTPLRLRDQHLLCGLFNSFVVNFLARLRVTTHVTTAIVEQLPVPVATAAPAACRAITELARRLRKRRDAEAMARLNAIVARLYQLTTEEFAHVLTTFPLCPAAERDAALEEFRRGRLE